MARAAGRLRADEILAEHVSHTVDLLLDRSRLLAERVSAGTTAVVGLCYDLADSTERKLFRADDFRACRRHPLRRVLPDQTAAWQISSSAAGALRRSAAMCASTTAAFSGARKRSPMKLSPVVKPGSAQISS